MPCISGKEHTPVKDGFTSGIFLLYDFYSTCPIKLTTLFQLLS